VARDKDGSLCLFYKKPYRSDNQWVINEIDEDDFGFGKYMYLDKLLFPNLTWNDEPLEIELKEKVK
jgi:hypothetical protein